MLQCPVLTQRRYERLTRSRLMNFSRNRPEMTNLNHQYAMRRVFIGLVLNAGSGLPARPMNSAKIRHHV